jgi:hypothetical protein
MKKLIISLFAAIVCGVVLFGCTLGIDAKGNPFGKVVAENNQQTEHFQLKVAKHYEDGFDLQIQLTDVKQAKGDWKVKYCGVEDMQQAKGKTIISGFGFSDCKDEASNDDNVYVQFTGEADGKQVSWNTVYKLTKEEMDEVPLEREDPTRWDDIRNFVESGDLHGAIQFGASKEEVIKFWGKPDTNSEGTLDYGDITFYFNQQNQLNDIIFTNTDESPIDVSTEEIAKAFGEPSESDGAAGTYYSTYDFNDYTAQVAWSNVRSALRFIDVKSKNY